MFPPYTLEELRDQVRRRADVENSTARVPDAEVTEAINKAAERLHSFLASLRSDLLIKTQTVTTTAGTAEYTLASDMMSLHAVRLTVDSDEYPLQRYDSDRVTTTRNQSWGSYYFPCYRLRLATSSTKLQYHIRFDPPPSAVATVLVDYIWGYQRVNDEAASTFPMQLPFPEYVILEAAIELMLKDEAEVGQLVQRREILEDRIRTWAKPVDRNQPSHIHDGRANEYDCDWPEGGW